MTKLTVARTALAAFLATTSTAALAQSATPPADAAEDREAMSELLSVDEYILRIQALDDNGPRLNAVIDYDPAASVTARQRLTVGPLHGRTVLVKDNIDTAGFATTAGSLALRDNRTGRDAPLIANLQASGGVVLGKTNLSEWANIRSDNSTSGWSAVGGLTRNPYAIERNTCGS
ncbi:MAG: amidase family protein, partial [Erythrobacteraceae bacterium]